MTFPRTAKGNTMRRILSVFVTALALSTITPLPIAYAQSATADGEIKKIDESTGKVTLRHGPMKALDMDMGMTMVYPVKDGSLLKGLKAGDKVKFQAERINGQITVTKIEK